MDWKAELAEANANLAAYREAKPDGAKGFSGMHKAAMEGGVIGLKEKEFMCLSIGIAKQCIDCIGFHVKAAIAAGATREEIAEVVSVAIYMGGGPSYMYGIKALEAFDQLSA
ncbi:MAG: carboxymuconolactone decarboxylase family protein [Rhodobacter sp.]|nr:carboxymuconolactone decarboxylase family protein [Paracoccaceae bacterium]MCC0077890.1 carboxymuconolactone decarboxylase family protein [Rhodobacter sp.]